MDVVLIEMLGLVILGVWGCVNMIDVGWDLFVF